jgi:hypothetical protein
MGSLNAFIVGGAGFGGVEYEDGVHDRGGPSWTAAQLGQDRPALEGGDCAFAEAAELGMARLTAFRCGIVVAFGCGVSYSETDARSRETGHSAATPMLSDPVEGSERSAF